MSIEAACPKCHHTTRVSDAAEGRRGACPECKTVFSIERSRYTCSACGISIQIPRHFASQDKLICSKCSWKSRNAVAAPADVAAVAYLKCPDCGYGVPVEEMHGSSGLCNSCTRKARRTARPKPALKPGEAPLAAKVFQRAMIGLVVIGLVTIVIALIADQLGGSGGSKRVTEDRASGVDDFREERTDLAAREARADSYRQQVMADRGAARSAGSSGAEVTDTEFKQMAKDEVSRRLDAWRASGRTAVRQAEEVYDDLGLLPLKFNADEPLVSYRLGAFIVKPGNYCDASVYLTMKDARGRSHDVLGQYSVSLLAGKWRITSRGPGG